MLLFVFVILTKKKRKKEVYDNFPDCFWDCFGSCIMPNPFELCQFVYLHVFSFNLLSSDVGVGGKEMAFIRASVCPKNCIHNFS